MSFALSVKADGIERLNARLLKIGPPPMSKLLEVVGAAVESQTRRRIEEEKTSPEGKAWAPWSPDYAATRHGGHSLLMGEGDLDDSLTHEVGWRDVQVGSNLVYAAIHQFGGAEVGMDIPERPYLGLSPSNEDELAGILDDFIDGLLG